MTTYQAVRDFTFAGTKYVRGDTFARKRPAIQIAGMLRARLIRKCAPAPASAGLPPPVAPVEAVAPKRKRKG